MASVRIRMRDGTKIEVKDERHAILHALLEAIKALAQVARDFFRRRRQAPSPRRKA